MQSESINPLGKLGYNDCVVCHFCNNNYLVRTIGNHWRYCEAYINQCLGDNENEKVEQEKKRWARRTKRYHHINPLKKLNNVIR